MTDGPCNCVDEFNERLREHNPKHFETAVRRISDALAEMHNAVE